jgi:hypothetical protein
MHGARFGRLGIIACSPVALLALPAKAVARWLQMESRVDTLIELGVASRIPLVY